MRPSFQWKPEGSLKMDVFGLWEETVELRENSHENMKTAHREPPGSGKMALGFIFSSDMGSFCVEFAHSLY